MGRSGLTEFFRKSARLLRRCSRLRSELWAFSLRRDVARLLEAVLFDPDFYSESNPDLSSYCRGDRPRSLAEHFVLHGGDEDRDPHPLFSSRYYKSQLSVAERSQNPLIHYLTVGWRRGLTPHPYFDPIYYREQIGEAVSPDEDPLSHFVRSGSRGERDPHPFFDVSFYRTEYPDVNASGQNPLVHFVRFGERERRRPNPSFDPDYYLRRYKDVAQQGIEPFRHYIEFGRKEGRCPEEPRFSVEQLAPSRLDDSGVSYPSDLAVDVIIPVYKGFDDTKRCIESVLAASNLISSRIIVINDCSPDHELAAYLDSLRGNERLTILTNDENLGFVETVNRGFSLSKSNDVVLLNSDTAVPSRWLDRLTAHAYCKPRVGTISPYSNNATICNFPSFSGFNEFPPDDSLELLDSACWEANRGYSVEIPTTVGSCMYIRRECIEEVGFFDAAAFGKGYGEENDFCCRATAKGWKHLLATDVFVYHKGEVSFGLDASVRKAQAIETIKSRYPRYLEDVGRFFECDPGLARRSAAAARRIAKHTHPVVLIVEHSLGGGVTRFTDEQALKLSSDHFVLRLSPRYPGWGRHDAELRSANPADGISLPFAISDDPDGIVDYLRACGVSRVLIHHVVGFPNQLRDVIEQLGVPFEFMVHDYYSVCPQINLLTAEGEYCNEPYARSVCNSCIAARPKYGSHDIDSWRGQHRWLFDASEVVHCPSRDTAERIHRYFPEANLQVTPHEPALYRTSDPLALPKILTEGETLRVGILGVLAKHKGSRIVEDFARFAAQSQLRLEFHLIGYPEDPIKDAAAIRVQWTGQYQDRDLAALIQSVDPHVLWFPARWPETYSYTLSAALASGRPIVASNIGAFPERLDGRAWVWWHSVHSQSDELCVVFDSVRKALSRGVWESETGGRAAVAARRY